MQQAGDLSRQGALTSAAAHRSEVFRRELKNVEAGVLRALAMTPQRQLAGAGRLRERREDALTNLESAASPQPDLGAACCGRTMTATVRRLRRTSSGDWPTRTARAIPERLAAK